MEPICDESYEMNSGQEIPGELVVSGGDATEVLEPAEESFDDISAFVGVLVDSLDVDTFVLLGMTGFAPRRTISPRRSSPSYPLSARSALMGGASARTSGAAAISASWPGVRCRTTGRQSGSLSAWIFVVRPPRERPIA